MRTLFAFFGLTYLASWSLFAGAARLAELATPGALAASTLVRLLGVIMPSLVALALTAWQEGAAGTGRLLQGLARWPREAWLWVFAAFFIATIKLTVALIHRLAFGGWPTFGAGSALGVLGMFAAILVSTPVQAGEEIGWRGFALPRLSDRIGLPAASVVLGVLWAAWHIPLFFASAGDTYGQSFAVYLVGVTALSVVLAWLYWRGDGSLILIMFAHAAINNTKDIVPSASAPSDSPWTLTASPVAWIAAGLLWLVAGALLLRMRGARLEVIAASAGAFPREPRRHSRE
jgi:membrane protease YdiL (CAAX protease family)